MCQVRAGLSAGFLTCLVTSGCHNVASQQFYLTDPAIFHAPGVGDLVPLDARAEADEAESRLGPCCAAAGAACIPADARPSIGVAAAALQSWVLQQSSLLSPGSADKARTKLRPVLRMVRSAERPPHHATPTPKGGVARSGLSAGKRRTPRSARRSLRAYLHVTLRDDLRASLRAQVHEPRRRNLVAVPGACRQYFDAIDENANGMIEECEVLAACEAIGMTPTRSPSAPATPPHALNGRHASDAVLSKLAERIKRSSKRDVHGGAVISFERFATIVEDALEEVPGLT
jgi:hypothetical protein